MSYQEQRVCSEGQLLLLSLRETWLKFEMLWEIVAREFQLE